MATDPLPMPMENPHEVFVRFINAADYWILGRKQRTRQCRRVLSVHCLSCRMRCKARRRFGRATRRTGRGSNPRRRCTGGWSTTRNTDESWRTSQSGRQALILICVDRHLVNPAMESLTGGERGGATHAVAVR